MQQMIANTHTRVRFTGLATRLAAATEKGRRDPMKLSDFLFVREGICLFCKEEETYGEILCRDCRKQLEAHGGEYAYDEVHSCSIAYFV